MKKDTIIIILLVVSAAILGTLFIGSIQSQKAYAGSSSWEASGDYIMASAQVTVNTQILFVIDVPQQKIIAYDVDGAMNKVTLLDVRNLKTAFAGQ
ncbi:MAG TPA: hypothetical protein PKK48_05005 [Phycisphaerae bacterium]|nr:hypothetical protein [Phycisphaerae bacterium]